MLTHLRRFSRGLPRLACHLALILFVFASERIEAQRSSPTGAPTRSQSRHLGPPLSQAIGNGRGAFGGTLAPGDRFGQSVAPLGDFNADTIPDLVVTAPGDVDGGALWLLYLRGDGSVLDQKKITADLCGCSGPFRSVDRIGDLDGDGVTDLIVGSEDAVAILFLNADGTVREHTSLAAGVGGLAGPLPTGFGVSVTRLGDLDGDGIQDAAVGSYASVLVLFLNADGTVRDQQEFGPGLGGFPVVPPTFPGHSGLGLFGLVVDDLGDFDGDGVRDLLVTGQEFLFEGELGHAWLTFLHADGTVKSTVNLSSYSLGLWPFEGGCGIWYGDGSFGFGASVVGDLDHDGVADLAVGSPYQIDGCCQTSPSVWVVNLHANGSVKNLTEITTGSAPHGLALGTLDSFGLGLASPGDIDGDGRRDLAIGAPGSFGTIDEYCDYADNPLGLLWLLFQQP